MPAIIYKTDSPEPVTVDDTQDEVVEVRVINGPAEELEPEPEPEPEPEEEQEVLVPISESEISELKKQLKRIANKRAIAIASKLSSGADGQDEALKAAEKLSTKIDMEMQRLSGSTKQSSGNSVSSMLVESGAMHSKDELKEKLLALKEKTKEQVLYNDCYEVAIVIA